MRTIYAVLWLLFAGVVAVIAVAGPFSALASIAFSLTALGLFYAFVFWTVYTNTKENAAEQYK